MIDKETDGDLNKLLLELIKVGHFWNIFLSVKRNSYESTKPRRGQTLWSQ